MKKIKRTVLATSLAIMTSHVAARTLLDPPEYFAKEGALVTLPSRIGGGVGAVAGGIVGAPFGMISGPVAYVSGADYIEAGAMPSLVMATGFGEAGYHLLGGPFYVVKKIVVDGPVFLKGLAYPETESLQRSGLIADVEAGRAPQGLSWNSELVGGVSASGSIAGIEQSQAAEDVPASEPVQAAVVPGAVDMGENELAVVADQNAVDSPIEQVQSESIAAVASMELAESPSVEEELNEDSIDLPAVANIEPMAVKAGRSAVTLPLSAPVAALKPSVPAVVAAPAPSVPAVVATRIMPRPSGSAVEETPEPVDEGPTFSFTPEMLGL